MSALRQTLATPPFSPAELHFLRRVPNDTEDAPWMVMNERQWHGASVLYGSLEAYARTHRVPWYPGGMLPLTYLPPGARRRKQVAPDVFAATVPLRGRDSLAIEEAGLPPFVLEVVSASSVRRDLQEKTELYRLLGAQEYAIVRLDLAAPRLEGYRRTPAGAWETWTPDDAGQLWSGVLGLGLLLVDDEVRAVTRAGELLPTLPEETAARQAETQARAQAEEEVARLRTTLERLTRAEEDKP